MKEKESLHNSELPSFLESPHREVPVVFTVPTSLNGVPFPRKTSCEISQPIYLGTSESTNGSQRFCRRWAVLVTRSDENDDDRYTFIAAIHVIPLKWSTVSPNLAICLCLFIIISHVSRETHWMVWSIIGDGCKHIATLFFQDLRFQVKVPHTLWTCSSRLKAFVRWWVCGFQDDREVGVQQRPRPCLGLWHRF